MRRPSPKLLVVDAFADRPFGGNPAAVCILDSPREAVWMQAVAAEMNLSETAFTWPEPGRRPLRWFTPTVEVALCGHATLASAHALWETAEVAPNEPIRFASASGPLGATREGASIRLDFPALPTSPQPTQPPSGLLEALGLERARVFAVARPVAPEEPSWLVELDSVDRLDGLKPDFAALGKIPCHGIIATARGEDGTHHFVSRFFAPSAGVDEDPVTGAAHCSLAPHWGARLGLRELLGQQRSARRGVVRVRLVGDRVHLVGNATTVVVGELRA